VRFAEGLAALGLRTAKGRDYAPPLPKPWLEATGGGSASAA
jgi:hypothetical protein